MTLGDKLAKLRRENNFTQEQLAELLGVSRQSVSKWESDLAYPETEKLLRLGETFGCSMDYLLRDDVEQPDGSVCAPAGGVAQVSPVNISNFYFERKSKRTLFGMPLVHVNVGAGRTAKGVIAIGIRAKGLLSIGVLSLGLISVGVISVGILAFGAFALGLLAGGAIAVGAVAAGAIAVGLLAFGALAIGEFSAGALAVARYFADGYEAHGMIAIGDEKYFGTLFQQKLSHMTDADRQTVVALLEENVPAWLRWCIGIAKSIIRA